MLKWFRKKGQPTEGPVDLLRVSPQLFPGGQQEIIAVGSSIASLLDNRIPASSAASLYASAKYLQHTASDRSDARIERYLVERGMGRLSADDAREIRARFLQPASDTAPAVRLRESFSWCPLDAQLEGGRVTAVVLELDVDASDVKQWLRDKALLKQLVDVIEKRIREQDVTDAALSVLAQLGERPDPERYSDVPRVVLARGEVAIHWKRNSKNNG